jgi:hypothetical protein
MSILRKETAWKKSRKFGDVKGGRRFPKVTDNIFARYHSIQPPTSHDKLPIFYRDNPSKHFYFPANEEEILNKLHHLPKEFFEGITHVWLRKVKEKDLESNNSVQGLFICGSGVKLIVLNAFPKNLRMSFGDKKPTKTKLKFYSKWCDNLIFDEKSKNWYLQWEKEKISDYFLNYLLLHEVGHFFDSFNQRFWSKANVKKQEDFANMFAVIWNSKTKEIIEDLKL